MARIAVVGSGAWGTALACHLARLEHTVTMWAYEPEVAEEITTRHTNSPYLPDVALPETIRASVDPRQVAASADVVILVPPSSHLRAVSMLVAPGVRRDAIVVVATKGIEERTLKLMSMVLEETMPGLEPERLAFLSGPTFAREVAQGLPTDVVVASKGMVAARKVQDLVHSVALRTYTSADPVGVQAGGARPPGVPPRLRRPTPGGGGGAPPCRSRSGCPRCCPGGGRSGMRCASCSGGGTRKGCRASGVRDRRCRARDAGRLARPPPVS